MASNQITRGNASAGALNVREDLTVGGSVIATGVMMVSQVALGMAAGGGGAFAWANPTDGTIVIDRLTLHISDTAASGTAIDIGIADDATTSSDTLLDGVSAQSTLPLNSDGDATTEQNPPREMTADQYVTATHSAAVTSFAATAYIYWHAA